MCGYYNFRCEYARERSTCHAMKGHVYILASKRSGTWYTGVTWALRAASLSSRFMKRAEDRTLSTSSLMWTAPPCKCFLQIF